MDFNKAKGLWEQIKAKRKELGEAYEREGSTEKVLALSQELDQLLNEYDKLMEESKEP